MYIEREILLHIKPCWHVQWHAALPDSNVCLAVTVTGKLFGIAHCRNREMCVLCGKFELFVSSHSEACICSIKHIILVEMLCQWKFSGTKHKVWCCYILNLFGLLCLVWDRVMHNLWTCRDADAAVVLATAFIIGFPQVFILFYFFTLNHDISN